MRNGKGQRSGSRRWRHLWPTAVAAGCAGCSYVAYIPLIILAPFMPLIQLAIKLGARYGPLLLMLVEADPMPQPQAPPGIVVEPRVIAEHTQLPDLEQQLLREATAAQQLRTVYILESTRLTPEWLEAQARRAQQQGLRVRMVFVDSRRFRDGAILTPGVAAALTNACADVRVTPGLAAQVAGPAARSVILAPAAAADVGAAALLGASALPQPCAAPDT